MWPSDCLKIHTIFFPTFDSNSFDQNIGISEESRGLATRVKVLSFGISANLGNSSMVLSTLRHSHTDCFLSGVTVRPRHMLTRLRKGREINWLWLSKLHQEGCCNCTGFPEGNDCSGTSDPNSRWTRRHLPADSKLCKCIPRTQCALREWWLLCFCTDQLQLYYQKTSHQQVASSVFLSENTSTWWDLRSYSRENCSCVFFHQAGDCKYSRFVRHKCCFHFRPRVLGSVKRFPTASELGKDTPRTHRIILLGKRPGKSVLWVLLPYLLLPSGQNYTVGWFEALISKCLCFQKTQTL